MNKNQEKRKRFPKQEKSMKEQQKSFMTLQKRMERLSSGILLEKPLDFGILEYSLVKKYYGR